MSATSHEQLAMYMTAKDLKGAATHSFDTNTGESMPAMWDRKLAESKTRSKLDTHDSVSTGMTLHESVRRDGVQDPVSLEHYHADEEGGFRTVSSVQFKQGDAFLNDGHHRVAAAHDINPNMLIPVDHE